MTVFTRKGRISPNVVTCWGNCASVPLVYGACCYGRKLEYVCGGIRTWWMLVKVAACLPFRSLLVSVLQWSSFAKFLLDEGLFRRITNSSASGRVGLLMEEVGLFSMLAIHVGSGRSWQTGRRITDRIRMFRYLVLTLGLFCCWCWGCWMELPEQCSSVWKKGNTLHL